MTAPKGTSGSSGGLVAILALLGVGLGATALWLHAETSKAEETLGIRKDEYRRMVDRMKPALENRRKGAKPTGPSNEDLLTFLSRKAGQAKIPATLFNIQRNQELKSGGWKEQSYTVNLRGAKDAPVIRDAVADFVRLVETERPAVRVKNLALAFAGNDLGSAAITFSAFEREGP